MKIRTAKKKHIGDYAEFAIKFNIDLLTDDVEAVHNIFDELYDNFETMGCSSWRIGERIITGILELGIKRGYYNKHITDLEEFVAKHTYMTNFKHGGIFDIYYDYEDAINTPMINSKQDDIFDIHYDHNDFI